MLLLLAKGAINQVSGGQKGRIPFSHLVGLLFVGATTHDYIFKLLNIGSFRFQLFR